MVIKDKEKSPKGEQKSMLMKEGKTRKQSIKEAEDTKDYMKKSKKKKTEERELSIDTENSD